MFPFTFYSEENFRFLIADARSYTAALANRTKGGGFEPEGEKDFDLFGYVSENFMSLSLLTSDVVANKQPKIFTDYYTNSNVVFMGLPNIHYVRQSFHQLQQHLNSADQNNFYHGLHTTSWLQYICQLFTATERCLNSLLEGDFVISTLLFILF